MLKKNSALGWGLILLGGLLGLMVPKFAAAESVTSAHVTAQLMPEVSSIQSGNLFWVALRLDIEEGWHTYWKNPGDSGLPIKLSWNLPEGWQSGPALWPYPERFKEAGFSTYGYHGEVFLLFEIHPPASLTVGQSQTLEARARWLSCEKICVPGQADLSFTLSISETQPVMDEQRQGEFDMARRRMPKQNPDWQPHAVAHSKQFVLNFSSPDGVGDFQDVYFFPETNDIIDHAGKQKLKKTSGLYELSVPKSSLGTQPTHIKGILVLKTVGQTGSHEMAFEVDAPVVKQ